MIRALNADGQWLLPEVDGKIIGICPWVNDTLLDATVTTYNADGTVGSEQHVQADSKQNPNTGSQWRVLYGDQIKVANGKILVNGSWNRDKYIELTPGMQIWGG